MVFSDAVTREGFLEEVDHELDGSCWMAELKLEVYDQAYSVISGKFVFCHSNS